MERVGSIEGGKILLQCSRGHYVALKNPRDTTCKYCRKQRRIKRPTKGEQAVIDAFGRLGIGYQREVVLPEVSSRRYDFVFSYGCRRFILEWDGEQHFSYIKAVSKSKRKYQKQIETDRVKTWIALHLGYTLIRLDYNSVRTVELHLRNALTTQGNFYVSNLELYKGWLLGSKVNREQLKKDAPFLFLETAEISV